MWVVLRGVLVLLFLCLGLGFFCARALLSVGGLVFLFAVCAFKILALGGVFYTAR